MIGCLLTAVIATLPAARVEFEKITLTNRYYCDGITATDINSDGHLDVLAGPFWYAGPSFDRANEIYEPVALPPADSPSNSMFSFAHDFNGDARPDVLVLGRVHRHEARWYENPGRESGTWKRHFVFERIRGESPTLVSLLNNGRPQLITHWTGRWGYVQPVPDNPYAPWAFTAIGADEQWPQFYHGQGTGDLNGDGRTDIVINDGWYEQPEAANMQWPFHRHRFSNDRGGAQMYVFDVDNDGDSDVISSVNAHGWGLAWYEQTQTNGQTAFQQHLIMNDRSDEAEFGVAFSQPHALAHADIDGDTLPDIVTGKRVWAHGPTGDVEPGGTPVLYWFQLVRSPDGTVRYVPHLIDDSSGVGVQVTAKDVNSDGRIDILTASKLGSFVFLNRTGTR